MEWVCITALFLAVTWRPFASYQIPLDVVVCAGSLMGVLVLLFIKHEMETHFDVDNRSNPAEASRCKTVSATVLSLCKRCTAGEIIRELRMTLENKPVNAPRTKNDMRKGA